MPTSPARRPAPTHDARSAAIGERMPIEELARRTGMTVRNLRALQASSLLEPPELKGRKGFYTERHLARVGLVRRLQGQGFSLAAIRRLIEGWQAGAGLMEVAGFEDALITPGSPRATGEADVATAFPELLDSPRDLATAIRIELVVRRDGRVIAPSPELLDIVKEEVRAGMPLRVVLEEGERLYADMERIAERFRQSFYKHVVDGFVRKGAPASDLATLADKVTRLRPMSVRSATIMLSRAMERGVGPKGKPLKEAKRSATRRNRGKRR